MKKALILGQFGIGDTISNTMTLAHVLREQGFVIHGVFHNIHSYRLMRETPYFDCCLCWSEFYKGSNYHNMIGLVEMFQDTANLFPHYDAIYITSEPIRLLFQRNIAPELFALITPKLPNTNDYRPVEQLTQFGFVFKDEHLRLDITWYAENYKDFECRSNTVVFNGESSQFVRCFSKNNEVRDLLTERGFDVRFLNFSEDIRKNLHLIHQAPYMLTTDTSTVWMSRALGKEPFVFLTRGRNLLVTPDVQERRLRTKNILKEWKNQMQDVMPEEIVEGFIGALRMRTIF